MEGNGQPGKDGTDSAPIRPVSSLLSHFENLSHRRSPSALVSNPTGSSHLKTPESGDDSRIQSRASLDLPRSQSPWEAAPNARNDSRHDRANGNGNISRPTPSPRGRVGRPMSMTFQSSPQLAPVVTVNSPQSPPRGFISSEDRFPSRSPRESWTPSGGSESASRDSLSLGRAPYRASTRPTTPQFEGTETSMSSPPQRPSARPRSGGRQSSTDWTSKSGSVPPPVNRAEKPKIPAKPMVLTQAGGNNLAPRTDESNTLDRAISPFSTPPSSPEKLPARPVSTAKNGAAARPLSRVGTEPMARQSLDERGPMTGAGTVRDARDLGFSRARPAAQPSRDTEPLKVQIPGAPSSRMDPLSGVSYSTTRTLASDNLRERPGLPSRHLPSTAAPRSERSPQRQHLPGNHIVCGPVTDKQDKSLQPSAAISSSRQTSPQPSFSRATKPNAVQNPPPRERPAPRESELDDLRSEQAPVPRTDYPDSTHANRRPPLPKSGPKEIHTGYDTRLFDVCGKYICTTGFLTRVWDVATGAQIMSLSHGETVKCLSLAFKPGKGLEDEGQRLWLGTSIGELHEVDILSQSIVASRSYPSRREVTKIIRHQKEMWTIDDEGRLLVWPPDETGTPNLLYSYHDPRGRVARGHTFSMAVGDTLWVATGKEVHVYRPGAHDDASFKVLKRPLGSQHSGDVTSGAYTGKNGGRVYLGHADGRVTVYSSSDYACLASVNVSVYKINCLGMVGDYLWAAYKTGMIYVYDVTTNPWLVKKDWRAHDSPISAFCADSTSVWTLNRLQVTSLGDDNCLRLWDGMLEDDWLETRMQSKDIEFCTFREIRAAVLTWNAGASVPGNVKGSKFIYEAVHPEDAPEILVFGFQELVDLEDKKITAKSLLLGSKKKEVGEKEHMSRQYRVWMEHLTRSINDCMPLEESYVLLHTANLIGLFTCVFVKHTERQRITNLSAAEIKRGMGGLHGNKGALVLRFVLDDSSLCFINCHLAAGQTQTANRNNDIAAILEAESLPAVNSFTARADQFVGGGDGSMIMDHEICILNGDLNYRIDSIPRNVIVDAIRTNNLSKLLERDQLLASRRKNPGFRLRSFVEAPINFAPTYKYDVGSDEYDSSDKKRLPAWCDRILYRGIGRVKQLEYRRHEVRASDHRPVSAYFKLRIKRVLPDKRAAAWDACQQEFQKEKRRLASEASIEYLINVLGTDPQQARTLILGEPAG